MKIKWRIEAETFNKSLFTLMRTNLSNLLTNRINIPKVKLLIENKEPATVSQEEVEAFNTIYNA